MALTASEIAHERTIRERYAGKGGHEQQMIVDAVLLARALLVQHREAYERLVEAQRYMDNVGCLLDPTLYRDILHSRSLAAQMKMIKAALKFIKDSEEGSAELAALAEGDHHGALVGREATAYRPQD